MVIVIDRFTITIYDRTSRMQGRAHHARAMHTPQQASYIPYRVHMRTLIVILTLRRPHTHTLQHRIPRASPFAPRCLRQIHRRKRRAKSSSMAANNAEVRVRPCRPTSALLSVAPLQPRRSRSAGRHRRSPMRGYPIREGMGRLFAMQHLLRESTER